MLAKHRRKQTEARDDSRLKESKRKKRVHHAVNSGALGGNGNRAKAAKNSFIQSNHATISEIQAAHAFADLSVQQKICPLKCSSGLQILSGSQNVRRATYTPRIRHQGL